MSIASPPELAVPADPLRTRLSFFSVLEPDERQTLLREALEILRAHQAEARQECEQPGGDPYDRLAAHGALAVLEARIRWLEKAERDKTAIKGNP